MENQNFEYKGWKTNGFLMLFFNFLLTAGAIYGFVMGIQHEIAWLIGTCVTLIIISLINWAGFIMLEPNEARVMVFFGEYRGTFYTTGYHWVNPFMNAKKISLRAGNLNVDPIKVNDKTGNPIMIGLVVVWRINRDHIYKAVFDIDAPAPAAGAPASSNDRMNVLQKFVAVQSDAALREVAGRYAYDHVGNNADELTLRSSNEVINEELEQCLVERLDLAGIEIMEARINYLAYAPEIAAVMLRRQQADAIISAREKIVEGAVSMVQMALEKIAKESIVELDNEKKAAMVGNLLLVLCSDESATPVVQTNSAPQH